MKRYRVEVVVNEESLIDSYTGGDDSISREGLPSTEGLLEFEFEGWMATSGVQLIDIEEVEEND